MKKISLILLLAVLFSACNKESTLKVDKTSDVAVNSSKKNLVQATSSTINFSGYTWKVKQPTGTQGPHNNYWSADNVWVDSSGRLHLRVRKNPSNNRWECAEVQSTNTFGYGTYQWKIVGALDVIDKNIVFGLFNYSGNDGHDEMDIEFSRWGYPNANMLNYSIWPATGNNVPYVTYNQSFSLNGTYTTHRFKRTSTSVEFKSLNGFQDGNNNLFASKTWSTPTSISTLAMPVFMNLWLFNTQPPSNGQDLELIISEFKFTPL